MSSRTHRDRRLEPALHLSTPDTSDGSLVYVAGAPLDLTVVPSGPENGSKHPARIEMGLGGAAGNGSPAALVNGIACHLISPLGHGPLGEVSRSLAVEKGLIPHFITRPEGEPAISVSIPSGRKPGARDLYIQRLCPPRLRELAPFGDVIAAAHALIVGPMPVADGAEGEATIAMLCGLAEMASEGYRALIPHPTFTAHSRFAEVARQFTYLQVNADEARVLAPAIDDLTALGDRWLDLLGEDRELAITNGDRVGHLWVDGEWWPIVPAPVETMSDVGAGDIFGSAWVVARGFFRAGVPAALDYAVHTAATFLAGGQALPYPIRADEVLTAC
jgi:sugar/nucleoside kinase (ribokinase family)